MAPDEPLPPPSSGVFLETSFRRLLASCEEIMGGNCKGREDLRSWRTSPVFHHYVETLQDQVAQLSLAAGGRIEPGLVERYRARVAAIAGQLGKPELPAARAPLPALQNGNGRSPALPLKVPDLPPTAANSRSNGASSEAHPPSDGGAGAAAPTAAPPPLQPAAAAGGVGAGRPLPPVKTRPAAAPPSQAAQARLQTQANLQDALTEELAGMAASLKSSTLAVEGKLRERGQLLDATETALDHSVQHTKRSAAEASRIHKTGRLNFCLTLLVMLVVGLTFAGVYVFIKATSFAGYRAARHAAPAPAPGPGGEL